MHKNKDLLPYKDICIREYFKNKNKIHLKIIQITKENSDSNKQEKIEKYINKQKKKLY